MNKFIPQIVGKRKYHPAKDSQIYAAQEYVCQLSIG